MASRNWWCGSLVLAAALACGGTDLPPAGTPAASQPAATPDQSGAAQAAGTVNQPQGPAPAGSDSAQQGETQLQREVFAYRGAVRDPFLSLIHTGGVRPLLDDLRVTTINYDPRYPSRSVAVLRDVVAGKRYSVHVGDILGRLRILQIRESEVSVTFEEFGVERQDVLRLRRRQEER